MHVLARAWNWLRSSGESTPTTAQEHSRFHYSSSLIAGLKGDHSELIDLYTDIERRATEGRYAGLPAALVAFRSRFDLHLLNENLHFYCYVEERAASAEERDLIKGFRWEMNSVAGAVVNFVKRYRMSGVNGANGQDFMVELHQVGALLIRRIEREEKELYTLYRP